MANRRLTMKKIREILRYDNCGINKRKIAQAFKISKTTVADYVRRFEETGMKFEEAMLLKDSELRDLLTRGTTTKKNNPRHEALTKCFPQFRKELTRVGVTKQLLWEEYLRENPDGYQYSQFCHHYQQWLDASKITMHQEHKAGDKAFVDFAGKKFSIIDFETGKSREVETFVGVLGASGYTYVEAVETQQKHDWICCNEGMFMFYGGVPQAIVPDCLKSAVKKPDRYEPDLNPEYADFARHYNTTILPARVASPKDKALVENAVSIVYKWIYAPLRNRTFFSIDELNEAIREKLIEYNERILQEMQISRRELFEQTDKPALMPLPAERFAFKIYRKVKAHINYHVRFNDDNHYYSVPYRYRGKEVTLIATDRTVEISYDNVIIARHRRVRTSGRYTTEDSHMPSSHKAYADWNPQRIISNAFAVGGCVAEACRIVLNRCRHPEQGFKTCMGIISLGKKYTAERVNNACRRALSFHAVSYKRVKNILENNLDMVEDEASLFETLPEHSNIRGEQYYFGGEND